MQRLRNILKKNPRIKTKITVSLHGLIDVAKLRIRRKKWALLCWKNSKSAPDVVAACAKIVSRKAAAVEKKGSVRGAAIKSKLL